MTKAEWYAKHGCRHAHCPHECEHPQPFVDDDGVLLCGRCWFKTGERTKMIPCAVGICEMTLPT